MSVKAPAEKNFRRARLKPSKRKRRRYRISWRAIRAAVCGVLVIYCTYRAFDLVVSASALQVQRISVHGNERLSAGEVQALVEGLRGTSILTADLSRYRRRLLDSPWVSCSRRSRCDTCPRSGTGCQDRGPPISRPRAMGCSG